MVQNRKPNKCAACGKEVSDGTRKYELRGDKIYIRLPPKGYVFLCGAECERAYALRVRDETIRKEKAWRGRLRQAIQAKAQESATDL